MKRPVSIAVASFALVLIAAGGIASCKQGEGERCQIQSDCEDGLVCNEGEHVCRSASANDRPFDADFPEANVPIDAPDAAIDAM